MAPGNLHSKSQAHTHSGHTSKSKLIRFVLCTAIEIMCLKAYVQPNKPNGQTIKKGKNQSKKHSNQPKTEM